MSKISCNFKASSVDMSVFTSRLQTMEDQLDARKPLQSTACDRLYVTGRAMQLEKAKTSSWCDQCKIATFKRINIRYEMKS